MRFWQRLRYVEGDDLPVYEHPDFAKVIDGAQ
jgi:hypothetical protein